MLTLNKADHANLIVALREFHRTKKITAPVPGVTIAKDSMSVTIDYGNGNPKTGTIRMGWGQYSITEVTNENNAFVKCDYTHTTEPIVKRQDYKNALSCTNLSKPVNPNVLYKSAIINLTAECCRSNMVYNAYQKLIGNPDLGLDSVWAGLDFAFHSYSPVCDFIKNDYKAGNLVWRPLEVKDYLDFINSRPNTNNTGDSKAINDLDNFITKA